MTIIEKADKEIADGNLWRAKEILQGSIGHSGYNIEIYEKFGNVLMLTHDFAEAGKYLFLSGIRKPEYEQAINIFLQKYEGKPYNLFNPFPRAAKKARISDYPEAVAEKLRELKLPEQLKDVHGVYVDPPDGNDGKYIPAIIITILLIVVILIILGIIKLFEIIF